MTKVILFSRRFPKGHVLAGRQTMFVEKIYAALRLEGLTWDELFASRAEFYQMCGYHDIYYNYSAYTGKWAVLSVVR